MMFFNPKTIFCLVIALMVGSCSFKDSKPSFQSAAESHDQFYLIKPFVRTLGEPTTRGFQFQLDVEVGACVHLASDQSPIPLRKFHVALSEKPQFENYSIPVKTLSDGCFVFQTKTPFYPSAQQDEKIPFYIVAQAEEKPLAPQTQFFAVQLNPWMWKTPSKFIQYETLTKPVAPKVNPVTPRPTQVNTSSDKSETAQIWVKSVAYKLEKHEPSQITSHLQLSTHRPIKLTLRLSLKRPYRSDTKTEGFEPLPPNSKIKVSGFLMSSYSQNQTPTLANYLLDFQTQAESYWIDEKESEVALPLNFAIDYTNEPKLRSPLSLTLLLEPQGEGLLPRATIVRFDFSMMQGWGENKTIEEKTLERNLPTASFESLIASKSNGKRLSEIESASYVKKYQDQNTDYEFQQRDWKQAAVKLAAKYFAKGREFQAFTSHPRLFVLQVFFGANPFESGTVSTAHEFSNYLRGVASIQDDLFVKKQACAHFYHVGTACFKNPEKYLRILRWSSIDHIDHVSPKPFYQSGGLIPVESVFFKDRSYRVNHFGGTRTNYSYNQNAHINAGGNIAGNGGGTSGVWSVEKERYVVEEISLPTDLRTRIAFKQVESMQYDYVTWEFMASTTDCLWIEPLKSALSSQGPLLFCEPRASHLNKETWYLLTGSLFNPSPRRDAQGLIDTEYQLVRGPETFETVKTGLENKIRGAALREITSYSGSLNEFVSDNKSSVESIFPEIAQEGGVFPGLKKFEAVFPAPQHGWDLKSVQKQQNLCEEKAYHHPSRTKLFAGLPQEIKDDQTLIAFLPELQKIRNFCRCFVEKSSLRCPLSRYATEESKSFDVRLDCFLEEKDRALYDAKPGKAELEELENKASQEIEDLRNECKMQAQGVKP